MRRTDGLNRSNQAHEVSMYCTLNFDELPHLRWHTDKLSTERRPCKHRLSKPSMGRTVTAGQCADEPQRQGGSADKLGYEQWTNTRTVTGSTCTSTSSSRRR